MFLVKQKHVTFGTKNVLFAYFKKKIEKTIIIFEISTLKFVQIQSFVQIKKALQIGDQKYLF